MSACGGATAGVYPYRRTDGCLVLAHGSLVAVLSLLTGAYYADLDGHWYLEAGFGLLEGVDHPTFPDLDAAQDWIKRWLERAA